MAALNSWRTESTVTPPVPYPTPNPAATGLTGTIPPPLTVINGPNTVPAPASSTINEMVPPRAGGSVIQMPGKPIISGTARPISNNPWHPAITSTSPLPGATHGVAYTAYTFKATGGTSPYTWTATGVPAAMTLSTAGVLSGTPTAAGTASIVVTATDSTTPTAQTTTKTFSLTIA